ncbi:PHD finger protein 3-like [Armigeres subalbatus]|uniref:PHD finger protein 3-like n=1 Tax=Armigeres subalbatus TaxID=124917 RepID=UPI002ED34DF5
MDCDRSDAPSENNDPADACICVACEKSNGPNDFVACDKCDKWWHFPCAGVDASVANQDWICPQCLPARVAASVRSTASSRKADLQRKRLAEQQQLEQKQLELEKRQLALQKKHSEEKYDLEESLAEEADNRSVRDRVIMLEAREHENQVQDWVDKHSSGKQKSTVQSETTRLHPTATVAGNPSRQDESEGLLDVATNAGALQNSAIQQILGNRILAQNQPITAEALLLLENELRKCRLQLEQTTSSGKIERPDYSRGAIPKAVPEVRIDVMAKRQNQPIPIKRRNETTLDADPGHPQDPQPHIRCTPKPAEPHTPRKNPNIPSHSTSVPQCPSSSRRIETEMMHENRSQIPPPQSSQPNARSIYDEQLRFSLARSRNDAGGGFSSVSSIHQYPRDVPRILI